MIRRVTSTLPIVGILLALYFYFHATALYSIATDRDAVGGGYHHFRNYWCDLYVPVTYTGQENSGRFYALAATLALIAALFFFWFSVTALFVEYGRLGLIVRLAGAVAAGAASLIFTPLHDLVITVAAPLGFVAILATCIGLARTRRWPLLVLGLLAIAVAGFDYVLWKLGMLKLQQPMIQKCAFVLIFLWIVATALKVLRMPSADSAGAT